MKLFLVSILSFSLFAKQYVIKDLVERHAKESGKTLLVKNLKESGLLSKVSLDIPKNISMEAFRELLMIVLSDHGMTIINDDDFSSIINTRDTRYHPNKIDQGLSKSKEFVLYTYKLKFPVGSAVSRNMRPFLSRYGRIIDFKYSNLIMISDKADNVKSMINMFSNFDTKEAFERLKVEGKVKKRKKNRKFKGLKKLKGKKHV